MTRRTGNNYSGPRYLFSQGKRKPVKPTRSVEPSGLTLMGLSRGLKSSAQFTQADLDAAIEPHVDNEGYEVRS